MVSKINKKIDKETDKKIKKGKTRLYSLLLITSSLLGGCSSYSSSFSCGDAKGANCMSMDRVDRMISSGEIERFNEMRAQEKAKCRGGRCKSEQGSELVVRRVRKSEPVFLTEEHK